MPKQSQLDREIEKIQREIDTLMAVKNRLILLAAKPRSKPRRTPKSEPEKE